MPQVSDAARRHNLELLRLAELERQRAEAEAEAARMRAELDRLSQPSFDPYADSYTPSYTPSFSYDTY
jgi:hypothetical protein